MSRDATVDDRKSPVEFDLVRQALMAIIFGLLVLILWSFVF